MYLDIPEKHRIVLAKLNTTMKALGDECKCSGAFIGYLLKGKSKSKRVEDILRKKGFSL